MLEVNQFEDLEVTLHLGLDTGYKGRYEYVLSTFLLGGNYDSYGEFVAFGESIYFTDLDGSHSCDGTGYTMSSLDSVLMTSISVSWVTPATSPLLADLSASFFFLETITNSNVAFGELGATECSTVLSVAEAIVPTLPFIEDFTYSLDSIVIKTFSAYTYVACTSASLEYELILDPIDSFGAFSIAGM